MKLKKWNINRLWRSLRVNRKYKDRLFQKVFKQKEDLLALYNAINHTAYADAEELEITTLEDVIYLSMKNDVSFIISATMNLYEHQSTVNYNMPIRGLLYFARLYEDYIKEHELNIYQHRMIRLPCPQYIVFYNGREAWPDECILKLSDAFEAGDKEAALECCARMININMGHNEKLMESCKRLWDYSYFIAQINYNLDQGDKLEVAVKKAMDVCIQKNILRDILEKSKSEVYGMLLTEFDEKKYKKMLLREGREEGYEVGYNEADARMNTLYAKLVEDGRTDELHRAFKDKAFREELLQEYKL